MDLPDCPPGAEGYQDSVVEVPKKLSLEDSSTKAEQEFKDHLNSLKIKLEDGETRPMVERRGRDVSGKWIYLCYPCAAVCSGESILQTHISGKKHKTKLAMKSIWPRSIFEEHPYILSEKGTNKGGGATEKILQKMAEEVDLHNKNPSDLDLKYNKYRTVRCHIQDSIDGIKAPLIGLEYLIEHPPDEPHYEPSYICTLCSKQGHPRTIINHMTCFWHRCNYLARHFTKASNLLTPYRVQSKYREGVSLIMNRLTQRIEDKYGRLRPVNFDKEEYEKDKERIHKWIFNGYHVSENEGLNFEEVVDVDLITSLHKSNVDSQIKSVSKNRDPSPPIVAAPARPHFNNFTRPAGRQERRAGSIDSMSDISDDMNPRRHYEHRDDRAYRSRHESYQKPPRYEPYHDNQRDSPFRTRYAIKNVSFDKNKPEKEGKRAPNYEYKVKLAEEKRKAAEDSAKNTLAYHEKNPEKHPLYPEEWKKFWNVRYKEIQSEGKDPSKHDFKPEWIVFWTKRMKELHDEELRINILEIYRKLCLSPPDMRRRSAEPRRRSPEPRRRSPDPRRRSPEYRRKSPERRRSPESRRRSPEIRRDRRSPESRLRSPVYRPMEKHHSPLRTKPRSRSPVVRMRSPARTHINLESVRRSRSPLSRRDSALRNRSPHHESSALSLQTVMISDEEFKPDDGLSPWNSDNDLDSLGSLPDARSPLRARSHTGSMVSSRASHSRWEYPSRGAEPQDLGPAENVVATLRQLVALEDYLGSLGPKVVDLMTEALKMEKEEANSSEELLVLESAVVLIETAKEKLKGAVQAGLVPHAATAAVRTAVVRAAATLHEADMRSKRKQQQNQNSRSAPAAAPMPVAGVGEVDRAQIAQQMAAALIAQGKTDVSSEELALLVDAVVGMAEEKKREADVKRKVEARAIAEKASRPPLPPGTQTGNTASALQMLQFAYDENEKKVEKEDAPDAMDGLSDSDLETLLKNFNELSAEEQHSLIAYLKKLEAREPQRVERLRQYVSAAAVTAPRTDGTSGEQPKKPDVKPVAIESDDDDYTVEEVFKSATQKVKEDQIRQEMEIVKKTLEEIKSTPPAQKSPTPVPTIDLTKNISSATDLFALVQASIQSTSAANTAPVNQTADVVTSNTQPRSFGDLPEAPMANAEPITPQNIMPLMQQLNNFGHQGGYRPPMNQMDFGGNRNFQNEQFNPPVWDQRPMNMNNMQDNRGSLLGGPPMRVGVAGCPGGPGGPGYDNFNQGPRGNFMNGRMQDNYDTRPPDVHQQFGNFDQGNNFRGRGGGRGNFGGPMRGRGRGGYY